MKRRDLITLLGGVAAVSVVGPLIVSAQQVIPVIGFLHSGSSEQNVKRLAAFLKGLHETGFIEGQNVTIEYRWAAAQDDKLPTLAADLIRRQVAVITAPGSTLASVVAKNATATIPMVFAIGSDPVDLGLVAKLNRPGGNVTPITSVSAGISAKRLGVLRELVPPATHYYALVNPGSPMAAPIIKDLEAGGANLGIYIEVLRASTDAEIEAAFAGLQHQTGTVLVLSPDALFYSRRALIAALAEKYAVPAIFEVRDYVDAGGLMSYGADYLNVMQLAGAYTGRILKGEKPADLPVMQPEKFELVLNLKTAKALGITFPPTLLALADEVIE
jgi:putative tryptophan/tyrosine transport system substrate-binding protein